MRTNACLGLLIACLLGCADAAQPGAAAGERAKKNERDEAKATPASDPMPGPPPPPAPEGALAIGEPSLLVQTCDAAHPCPDLLQAAGEEHCAGLSLGALTKWRLPTREEVERWRGRGGLEQLAGYHWTSSAFDQDAAQVWIVDPTSDQPTTVPGDRKPFRIRCVRDP